MQTVRNHQTSVIALTGGIIWATAMCITQPGWAAALLVFAPVCLIPLALPLIQEHLSLDNRRVHFWILIIQSVSAAMLLVSFAFPQGVLAALFAGPWVFCCLATATIGFVHFLRRFFRTQRRRDIFACPVFFIEMAMLFLAVGGGWLLLSRLGIRPLGFSSIIVLATAVHFHYAGFLLPIIAAKIVERRRSNWTLIGGWGVLIGVPAVAVGITLSVWNIYVGEWLATWWLTAACWILALEQWRIALVATPYRRWILRISAVSLIAAMLLAAGYAFSRYWPVGWLDIPQMIVTHGALNVFGFALFGILGWR